jgi:hypothetical protein
MSDAALLPFAEGDVFAGATLLNDANDDHAGRGRILQYDAQLQPRAEVLLDDTTHLVGGLAFDAEGTLWGFDQQEWLVFRFGRDGRRLPNVDLGARPFSHVHFLADGSLLLGEHLVGSEVRFPLKTRFKPLPGRNEFGTGHAFRFARDGRLLHEYATATQGGMGGFLGLTMSALSPDQATLYYVSETGPRLMRYDLAHDRQLPDLLSFPVESRQMFFDLKFDADGRLWVLRGKSLDRIDDDSGELRQSLPLEGFGWALVAPMRDRAHALLGNFFTGAIVKLRLADGQVVASASTGVEKSLAGLAEFASP